MYPLFVRFLGLLFLVSALVTAQLLSSLPPANLFYWAVPAALLLLAALVTFKLRSWRFAGLLIVILAVAFIFYPWPTLTDTSSPYAARTDALMSVVLEVPPEFRQGPLAAMPELEVVEGLKVTVFAAGLDRPRMLTFGPQGKLYASLPHAGQVVVLPDEDRDGIADRVHLYASGLKRPHGLAFSPAGLVVATSGELLLLTDKDHDLTAEVRSLSRDVPGGGGHWTRSVALDSTGAAYVSAGSSCNACEEDDPRRAAILRIAKAGGAGEIYAHGLRNSVGLAFHPQTGELWASNNGRDMLGDDLPPEEINRIVAGGDYGWPYCYGQQVPDPQLGSVERCRETLSPAVEMQAHSAPLGIAFGHELKFPASLRQMLYVAFHGSWNRSIPTGYKLVGIPFVNGRPAGPPRDIVRGWLKGLSAWGRPVAPVVGPDGALYLSDDRAGAVYRIRYDKAKE